MSEYTDIATYPDDDQLERWEERAEELGFQSWSEFIQAMVEAGLKKFDAASVEPDETKRELREHRNDVKIQLDRARDRIDKLEDAVYHGEWQTIAGYVESNPGATYDDIVQHIIDTAAGRVTSHLEDMEGDVLRADDDGYYHRDEVADDREWV